MGRNRAYLASNVGEGSLPFLQAQTHFHEYEEW
jgi:hypothetical protein